MTAKKHGEAAAPAHWDKALSRELGAAGERIVTLRDAGRFLLERFQGVTKSAPLEHAIVLLMRAAASGRRADRAAATDQVLIVLRESRFARVLTVDG
jgi:hypothetical protein